MDLCRSHRTHGPLYGAGSRSAGNSAARCQWKGNEGHASESVAGGGAAGTLSGIQAGDAGAEERKHTA